MEGWMIAFIIMCVFYGPAYVLFVIMGAMVSVAPGTNANFSMAGFVFLVVLLGLPMVGVGFMAYKSSKK